MGSSSGGTEDYSRPPQGPPPPKDQLLSGSGDDWEPSFINFLGDTNKPSTGLTPQMLAQIEGRMPIPQSPAAAAAAARRAAAPAAAPAAAAPAFDPRRALAEAMRMRRISSADMQSPMFGSSHGGGGY